MTTTEQNDQITRTCNKQYVVGSYACRCQATHFHSAWLVNYRIKHQYLMRNVGGHPSTYLSIHDIM